MNYEFCCGYSGSGLTACGCMTETHWILRVLCFLFGIQISRSAIVVNAQTVFTFFNSLPDWIKRKATASEFKRHFSHWFRMALHLIKRKATANKLKEDILITDLEWHYTWPRYLLHCSFNIVCLGEKSVVVITCWTDFKGYFQALLPFERVIFMHRSLVQRVNLRSYFGFFFKSPGWT